MATDGDDLEILKAHRPVFLLHTQALAGNIDTSITDIDISSNQDFTQLLAHRQKHEYKIKKVKNIDTKILRLVLQTKK